MVFTNEEEGASPRYWYPAFKLRENPFRFFEARLESYVDGLPWLDNPMVERVAALIRGKVSTIVRGVRGCGKSTLIEMLHSQSVEDENVINVVTPKNMNEVYAEVYRQIDDEVSGKIVSKLWASKASPDGYPLKCWSADEKTCALCPLHCKMNLETGRRGRINYPEEYAWGLRFIDEPCPAKKKIILSLLGEFSFCDHIFLVDTPDNLDSKGLRSLLQLSDAVLGSLNTLIIFATPIQADMLRKNDPFLRLPIIDFELPGRSFFRELFKKRVEGFRGDAAPLPFEEEAVDRMAVLAGFVPREFIRLSNLVLTEMWLQSLGEPCGLNFLKELNIKPVTCEQEILLQVLQKHRGQWIGIQEQAKEIQGLLEAPFTERKTGAMLKKLGFTLRKFDASSGRAQVLIITSTLGMLAKKTKAQ